jgi:uncharacterized membrane protein YvlD (DUF360 family)
MEARHGLVVAAVVLGLAFVIAPPLLDLSGAATAVLWFGMIATVVAAVVAARMRR